MIRLLRHHEINMNKWDECILTSPGGTVYAFSWYLNHVAGQWDAIVEDDYQSVFPLPRKKKFGIKYALQPLWTQQLGLFSKNIITPEKSIQFLNEAFRNVLYFDMNLNNLQTLPQNYSFKLIENNNFQLQLFQSYEQIHAAYSDNLKRKLRKARDLILIENISHEPIISMFRKYRGRSIHKLDESAYKRFTALIYHCRSNGVAKIIGVSDKTNTLLCGAIFLIMKDKAILIFSAVSDVGREKSAMPWLIDGFIAHNQQKTITLDFEGSNDPNLARFYKSFGATNVPYLRIIKNKLPLPDTFIHLLRKK